MPVCFANHIVLLSHSVLISLRLEIIAKFGNIGYLAKFGNIGHLAKWLHIALK